MEAKSELFTGLFTELTLIQELLLKFINDIQKIDMEYPDLKRPVAHLGLTAGVDIVAYFFAEMVCLQEYDEQEFLKLLHEDFLNRKNYYKNLIEKKFKYN